jgi:hypothetical protein
MAAALPGLAVAADGFRLALESPTVAAGRSELAFAVLDDEGEPVRAYDVLHERRLHLIVVSRDLSQFRHLHPALGDDGLWRARTDFEPGVHRVFADFSSGGTRTVLGADVLVQGRVDYHAAPAVTEVAPAGPYDVTVSDTELRAGTEQPLEFAISRGGADVVPDPYLGARGHLVILRDDDLAYIHAHAEENVRTAEFETTLPSRGRYRAFLQFKAGGSVRTAEFVLEAS